MLTDFNKDFTLDEFANPPAELRGAPFWSWNGDLDKDELLRQVHVQKEMGLGGYFMHSRTGLKTKYLSDKWFELINACAEEGEKLGMHTWIYDEDRWPSGLAGGLVTKDPQHRKKMLCMQILPEGEQGWGDDTIAAFTCRIENEYDAYDLSQVTDGETIIVPEGRSYVRFFAMESPCGTFYNGYTYADTLSLETTREFIRITHEAYKKNCGRHFGKAIQGVFTDEPNRGAMMSAFGSDGVPEVDSYATVPYTPKLFEEFKADWGYDLRPKLVELFLRIDGKPTSPVKWQFVETVQRLFIENFARPCYEWCEENNLLLTGHILHENNFACQLSTCGSVQRYYPYMHIPGVDVLCEGTRDYWLAKQCQSVVRQTGRKWMLSELYGCTGWQLDFEAHKTIGLWQAIFGVNLRCHHLSWYTMKGQAKRDYPASILHQSPWYTDYEYIESYFARIGLFLQQGKPCCDILVLNPVESTWGRIYPGAIRGMGAHDAEIRRLQDQYSALFHMLAGNQLDFDYGDEGLLAEMASVEGSGLRVGESCYRTVLVYGMDSIRRSTLAILREFMTAGGRVVVADDSPTLVEFVDGAPELDVFGDAIHVAFDEAELIPACEAGLDTRVRVIDQATGAAARDVFCHTAVDGDDLLIMLLNSNRDESQSVDVQIHRAGVLEQFDAETGKTWKIAADTDGEPLTFTTSIAAGDALLLRVVATSEARLRPAPGPEKNVVELAGEFEYDLDEPNVCVLDVANATIDGKALESVDILHIDDELRDHFGVNRRAGNMIQPWFRGDEASVSLGRVRLEYVILIEDIPATMELAMEMPDQFDITLNGHPINCEDNGMWVDVAIRRLSLPIEYLKEQENTLLLETDFSENTDLEALYLLGDFGVRITGATPVITKLPQTIVTGDLVNQGFPFYTGRVTYKPADVPDAAYAGPFTIETPQFVGANVKIHGGDQTRMIAWQPYEARFEPLEKGDAISLEVCLTRRNVFGPLHFSPKYAGGYGPGHYNPHGEQYTKDYIFHESGLLSAPCLRFSGE